MSREAGRAALRAAVPALMGMLVAASLSAQAPVRGAFAVLRGADTLAVESFERTPTSLSGTLVARVGSQRISYRMELTPSGGATRMELAVRPGSAPDTAPPLQKGTITFSGDTATLEGNGTLKVAVQPGTLPYLNLSGACLEQMVRRWRASGSDSLPMLGTNGQKFTVRMRSIGKDSAVMMLETVELRLALAPDGRLLSAEVPSQGVRIVRLERVSMSPEPKPDYSAPAGAPYTAESVTVQGPGGLLAGTLTLPKSRKGRIPAVVTITGSGQEDRDEALPIVPGYRPFRQVADTLSRRGIAVLRLDDRGFGESRGSAATATSQDFGQDIAAAVAYLRARPDIDPARIALVGHSEGGMIAPMVAAADPKIRAIVLMAPPAWNGRRILAYQQRYGLTHAASPVTGAQLDSALAKSAASTDSAAARIPWLRFFMDYDPLPTARRVRAPVLILQGATDQQVVPQQIPELSAAFRAGGNNDVTVKVFPDRNHLFLRDPSGNPATYGTLPSRTIDTEVMGTMADWLVRELTASR